MSGNMISLDLGCGIHPKNPFNADRVFGVDITDFGTEHIKAADLAIEPIPFSNEEFDYVTAHDFIEHVPRVLYYPERRSPFIELMNEIWRVLKFGGVFFSHTPAFPHPQAFQDPTHVNIITDRTFFYYFDDKHRWASKYGFHGAFELMEQRWEGPHLLTTMKKVQVPNS